MSDNIGLGRPISVKHNIRNTTDEDDHDNDHDGDGDDNDDDDLDGDDVQEPNSQSINQSTSSSGNLPFPSDLLGCFGTWQRKSQGGNFSLSQKPYEPPPGIRFFWSFSEFCLFRFDNYF